MQDADEGGELSLVGDHGMRLWILAGIAGHASRAEAYNVPAVRIRLGGLTAFSASDTAGPLASTAQSFCVG